MTVTLGEEVGSGGEGAVFAVRTKPELVAKVYHAPIDATKAAKLLAMSQASSRSQRGRSMSSASHAMGGSVAC
jgi:DNA-binding helix-hairpin-helix protein with protein kinase domain